MTAELKYGQRPMRISVMAVVAVLFGLVTIFAGLGTHILIGGDFGFHTLAAIACAALSGLQ